MICDECKARADRRDLGCHKPCANGCTCQHKGGRRKGPAKPLRPVADGRTVAP